MAARLCGCSFLKAGGELWKEGDSCRLPIIVAVINYIHHNMSQHLTVLYEIAGGVELPCQPSNEDR